MDTIVHVGTPSSSYTPKILSVRVFDDVYTGLYYLAYAHKDKTLCNRTLTTLHYETITLDQTVWTPRVQLISVSWRKGSRPVYYTGFSGHPLCVPLKYHVQANCPECLSAPSYVLHELDELVL